jgi:hypothetical protein
MTKKTKLMTDLLNWVISRLWISNSLQKSNENDEADTLSRWFNYEEVKWVYIEILNKDNEILTKDLAATYRVKNVSLIDNKLI